MPNVRLPDGTKVQCIVRSEAVVLAAHTRGYLEHGITLPDDAIVLDVGANIGVFAVALAKAYPGVRVHAFEPIPPICDVLHANARAHGDGRITVHPYGVGAEAASFDFLYFPRCPALSTAHMELWEASPDAFREAVRGHLAEAGKSLWYARLVPPFLAGAIARYLQGGSQRHACEIRSLAQVLERDDVPHVDLLKIDCEGAELDVLRGVPDARWAQIHQVVCEVMDVEGRLDLCRSLLTAQGFDDLRVERESGLENTPLVNLYARRSTASSWTEDGLSSPPSSSE